MKYRECMLQKCPYCKQEQPILVRGVVYNPENWEKHIIHDRGYSFCNCKNIFYTEWRNIDQRIYDLSYKERYGEPARTALKVYSKKYFPLLNKLNPDIKTFCDLGALSSDLVCQAECIGWKSYLVDLSEPIDSKGYKVIYGDVENPNTLRDGKFDVLWASHLVEHLKTPIKTIAMLRENLNDEGLFFIAMPDPYFITWDSPYHWRHWWIREHHIFWDMETFIEEVERLGLRCVHKFRNDGSHNFIGIEDYHLIFKK